MGIAEQVVPAVTVAKLDLGCGTRKEEGFFGVDIRAFEGVDMVHDLVRTAWPWVDNSIEEVRASHLIEHFDQMERVFFFNELYRVLKPGGKATVTTPYWCSNRAYGDPTHKWPPVSEMLWYYLDATWRKSQAPHVDGVLTCDFQKTTWGYVGHSSLNVRSQKYQEFALNFYKDAALDMVATLTKAQK